jgi:indolepyruvate decarboxylase
MEDLPPFVPVAGKPITVARMFQAIDDFLDDRTIVIAEAGDALFGGLDLRIRHAVDFLAPAYYLSLGFGVPAAIGAQMADPNARPLVLSGDGAFQMTGMELSTVVRYGLNPIVVVLNNSGYGTERPMLDGSFNDITNWNYSAIPSVLGQGHGFVVRTEDEMPRALQEARARTDAFSIIDVHLERGDLSPALQRLTEFLGKRVT